MNSPEKWGFMAVKFMFWSCVLLRHAASQALTSAPIFYLDDGGNTFLWNVGNHLSATRCHKLQDHNINDQCCKYVAVHHPFSALEKTEGRMTHHISMVDKTCVSTDAMCPLMYRTTWPHIVEDILLHSHRCQHLKSYRVKVTLISAVTEASSQLVSTVRAMIMWGRIPRHLRTLLNDHTTWVVTTALCWW